MRILGIDPGLRVTGYGVIEKGRGPLRLLEMGVIRTDDKDGISRRLFRIHEGVRSIIKDLRPDILVLEKIFAHARHPTTALLMGHARGVICLASGECGIPLENMPSTRVKKAIHSNGHASKYQVQRAVQGFLSLKEAPKPTDVSDALAIAISYAFTKRNGA